MNSYDDWLAVPFRIDPDDIQDDKTVKSEPDTSSDKRVKVRGVLHRLDDSSTKSLEDIEAPIILKPQQSSSGQIGQNDGFEIDLHARNQEDHVGRIFKWNQDDIFTPSIQSQGQDTLSGSFDQSIIPLVPLRLQESSSEVKQGSQSQESLPDDLNETQVSIPDNIQLDLAPRTFIPKGSPVKFHFGTEEESSEEDPGEVMISAFAQQILDEAEKVNLEELKKTEEEDRFIKENIEELALRMEKANFQQLDTSSEERIAKTTPVKIKPFVPGSERSYEHDSEKEQERSSVNFSQISDVTSIPSEVQENSPWKKPVGEYPLQFIAKKWIQAVRDYGDEFIEAAFQYRKIDQFIKTRIFPIFHQYNKNNLIMINPKTFWKEPLISEKRTYGIFQTRESFMDLHNQTDTLKMVGIDRDYEQILGRRVTRSGIAKFFEYQNYKLFVEVWNTVIDDWEIPENAILFIPNMEALTSSESLPAPQMPDYESNIGDPGDPQIAGARLAQSQLNAYHISEFENQRKFGWSWWLAITLFIIACWALISR